MNTSSDATTPTTRNATAPRYEWRTDSYLGKWKPLDIDAMRMDQQGKRAFARLARLLKPGGKTAWFDLTRYRPKIGASCNANCSYEIRRTA